MESTLKIGIREKSGHLGNIPLNLDIIDSVESFKTKQEEILEKSFPQIMYHVRDLMKKLPSSNMIEFGDLVNSGVLGALESSLRFDSKYGIQFSTFASFRIRGAIIDYIRSCDHMSTGLRIKQKKIAKAFNEIKKRKGDGIIDMDVANHLGLSLKQYRKDRGYINRISIISSDDSDLNEGKDINENLLLSELIASNMFETPEDQAIINNLIEKLSIEIGLLPERSIKILISYYFYKNSMKDIANNLSVSESRISQIHTEIILYLREKFSK